MSLEKVFDDIKINILVVHHKKYEYIKSEYLIPIHVGKVNADFNLDYCVGDNTGDNISFKNKNWCELTAIYWQWKNVDADYYGLFHYRRYLSFGSKKGFFLEESLDCDVLKKYGLDDINIRENCKNFDIITSPFDEVYSTLSRGDIMTVYDHYVLEHEKSDIDDIMVIIKNKYPSYYESLVDVLSGKECSFGNIFIMKRKYFFEYCSFVFGVLSEFESIANIDNYDSYQSRVYGFLAERLTNVYLHCAIKKYKDIKVTQFAILQLCSDRRNNFNLLNQKKMVKNNKVDSNVNICMSFDDNYFNYALTAIKSLIINTSKECNLNIYVLSGNDLSLDNRKMFSRLVDSNVVSVFYRDVDDGVLNKLPLNMEYISVATYYRLLIDILLPEVNKVIYVDSDVVFLGDIFELWNTYLFDKSVGVVQDELGVLQQRRLRMEYGQTYFNAGIMVFDLNLIRVRYNNVFEKYMELFSINKKNIIFQDQDILNLAYKDDQFILPLKWNMGTGIFSKNMNETMYTLNDEVAALDDPGVIHFTGGHKPWRFFANHPCGDLYWKYRIKIKEIPLSFREWISYLNCYLFKFKYVGNGSFVSFFLLNKEIVKLPKKIIKKLLMLK